MKKALLAINPILFAVALPLVLISYPWALYYRGFDFPWWMTAGSYLFVALMVSSICSLCIGLLFRKPSTNKLTNVWRALGAGSLALVLLVGLAVAFGPGGLGDSLLRVNGIFFSEWKFVRFALKVALPSSAVAVMLALIGARAPRTSRVS